MAGYVSNWGNDINSGNDWAHACASFQGAADKGHGTIYAKGFFDEQFTNDIIGKGAVLSSLKVKLNLRSKSTFSLAKNCTLIHWQDSAAYENCYIQGKDLSEIDPDIRHTVINAEGLNKNVGDFTIYKSTIYGGKFLTNKYAHSLTLDNSILAATKSAINVIDNNYSLIIAHPIKLCAPTVDDLVESDFTTPASMTELRERAANLAGGNPEDYFIGCQLYTGPATDIFNDPDNDDYTLKPGTIATYMSYEGNYVGKYPPSLSWIFPDNFTNLVNFDGDKIADQTQDATADGEIKDIGAVRKITHLPVIDNPAYRNGINLNTEDTIGSDVASGDIEANHVYFVNGQEGDSITYDGTTYNNGEYFTGVDGVTTYTGDANVTEILFNNYKYAMQWKFSKDDPDMSEANLVTMKMNQEPKVNVDANNKVIAGNADDSFDESNAVDLDARYMQPFIKYIANQIMAV